MTVSAAQVKELRDVTGVGMMECKKALVENEGDLDKAILWLRERGLSRAAKKSGRTTAEGMVAIVVSDDMSKAVALEVNCETDFSGKSEGFVNFANMAAQAALANEVTTIEQLAETKMGESTVAEVLTNLITTVGENMQLRRLDFVKANNGVVVGYSHMGGKIGTLVALEGAKGDAVVEIGKDLAMQVAASAPKYLNREAVDATELAQEEDLAKKRLLESGKPENMLDKIMVGQMNKFYSEVCLVEQPFIKEPKNNVTQTVQMVDKALTVAAFTRFQLGEGIEKKVDNFAEEVAAQLKS